MKEGKPVLLSDVAQKAGVSPATASMALADNAAIASKTRELVRRAAEELGYRPNVAASLLARHRQESMLPGIPIVFLQDAATEQFNTSFVKHASQRGFLIEELGPTDRLPLPELFRILYYRGVRGIVLNTFTDTSMLTEKDVEPFSILFHGQGKGESRFHRVSTEVFEGTQLLWETIWNRGYRRIGAIMYNHVPHIQDDFAREAAIINCQVRHRAPRLPMYAGDYSDHQAVIDWIKKIKPDAIISFTHGQIYTLRAVGIKIPDEMGFATLHTSDQLPEVTGLVEDFEELGRMTAIHLDSMIRHNETGVAARPHQMLVSPVFYEGTTIPLRALPPLRPKRKSKANQR